jgi:NADH dehydrogenase (ubiquinone) 1 beta subcomplex subunit 9
MDASFKKVVSFYMPVANLSHRSKVMRLYRKGLRTIDSWAESRDVFNAEGTKLRLEFNAFKALSPESAKVTRLLREGYERLATYSHPDPYIKPYMPGGSLFMRNPAIPMEVLYPHGIPDGVSKRRLNIDMSDVPESQPYANKVFVDSANKAYWIDK